MPLVEEDQLSDDSSENPTNRNLLSRLALKEFTQEEIFYNDVMKEET